MPDEQLRLFDLPRRPHGGPCPYCGRIMSIREADEQECCNDCYEDHWGYPA